MPDSTGRFALSHVHCAPVGADWEISLYFLPAAPAADKKRSDKELIHPAICPGIEASNISIYRDSDRIPALKACSVSYRQQKLGVVKVLAQAASDGVDFHRQSRFVLELHGVPAIDPQHASRSFSLEPEGRFESDGQPDPRIWKLTAGTSGQDVRIDYQAKDYQSFLKQMEDVVTLHLPQWRERHSADVGVTILEILAYAADYLSYYQDAVATEAYLTTARRRISLRRHACMLDYPVNDGWNSRVWVQICVDADDNGLELARGAVLPAGASALPTVVDTDDYEDIRRKQRFGVFATMHVAQLYRQLNNMNLFQPGRSEWVLEKGAISATLAGNFDGFLHAGDVLIFSENLPGSSPDARRAHAIRLVETPNVTGAGTDAAQTRIEWGAEDALPWDLRIFGGEDESASWTVLGNIVLADYGRAVQEDLPPVPLSGRFFPLLRNHTLVFAEPYDHGRAQTIPASGTLVQSVDKVVPQIMLADSSISSFDPFAAPLPAASWTARRDLLRSGRFAREFVPETEEDGAIRLRFGDDVHGASPLAGRELTAHYRVSDYPHGAASAGVIAHIVGTDFRIVKVWNPMAAQTGSEPTSAARIRMTAPNAYRDPRRCVTQQDYAAAARQHSLVRDAVCEWRWTGSWQTAFVYVELHGGATLNNKIRGELDDLIEPLRMAGCDVEFGDARPVPLEVALRIYVRPQYFRDRVYRSLQRAFLGPGGLFDPDRFTFGEPVYLSRIISAAAATEGVERVEPLRLQRQGEPAHGELEAGVLLVGPLEVARLAGIPDAPEKGSIAFVLEAGAAA